MREVELDHAFAEVLGSSPEFRIWLLAGGRFARYAQTAKLMREQQAAARKAPHWWKHWWCSMPDGSQGETDIFAVFEDVPGRFALHIENKPPKGTLDFPQASAYRRRAIYKANDPRWLEYNDFETVLLAPASFLQSHAECLRQFDRGISYEDVAAFAPLFANALSATAV